MWPEGQWEASKKTALDGADTHTDRTTDGHGASMTNSAQWWGRVGEKHGVIIQDYWLLCVYVCHCVPGDDLPPEESVLVCWCVSVPVCQCVFISLCLFVSVSPRWWPPSRGLGCGSPPCCCWPRIMGEDPGHPTGTDDTQLVVSNCSEQETGNLAQTLLWIIFRLDCTSISRVKYVDILPINSLFCPW